MDVLSEEDCTDGVPGNVDMVPDNLDICVRDDNHGGDTQICFVCNFFMNIFLNKMAFQSKVNGPPCQLMIGLPSEQV